MAISPIEVNLSKNYVMRLKQLSVEARMKAIADLQASLAETPQTSFDVNYFAGIWKNEQSAEDLITEIKENRKFNRDIISFDD